VEGIETEAEALCAIDANADLMQGDYFAPASIALPPENARSDTFARLIEVTARISPIPEASTLPARALPGRAQECGAGPFLRRKIPAGVQGLLKLPSAERCYLIGSDGLQIGANVDAERNVYSTTPLRADAAH